MKITEIRIDKSMTVNLGNYNNTKTSIGFSVEIGDGDDPDLIYDALAEMIDEKLAEDLSDVTS